MKRLCVQHGCSYGQEHGFLCDMHDQCPVFKSGTPQECIKAYREAEKPKGERTTEDDEQEVVIEYCNLKHYSVIHIPNEGKRSKAYGARMKRLGMQKGFPDLFFPVPLKGYHGLMIEMKRDERSRVSQEQRRWIDHLNKMGYLAFICYGSNHAIREIEEYFRGNP